jgi:lysine 2,3-aminomutase
MNSKKYDNSYDHNHLLQEGAAVMSMLDTCQNLEDARCRLRETVSGLYRYGCNQESNLTSQKQIRIRDCANAINSVLTQKSEKITGFSVTQALWDIAVGKARPDLTSGFYAEIINWIKGLQGRAPFLEMNNNTDLAKLTGRSAAIERSDNLDQIWISISGKMEQYANGLSKESLSYREKRKKQLMAILGADEKDWYDWKWQTRHLFTEEKQLAKVIPLNKEEQATIARARKNKLPFAITPYYASLFDEQGSRDRAIRAQVIPPDDYVSQMENFRRLSEHSCDFMLESDTSPVDLITRRYPAIAIFKPCNACPQICVYCQRNWEIQEAMSATAIASDEAIDNAIKWIAEHPAIQEILITGGDPLILSDLQLEKIMTRLAEIDHVRLIRIGTRTPVTLPMRITPELAAMIGSFREVGRREIAVMTHIEHSYEITTDTAKAVSYFKREGIGVYNQHVYTFYVSRRFELAYLRLLLRRIGIDPYYTFAMKGKEETGTYRVPIARILQEQKEEARLIPGLSRTDEAVYNIPKLGKNYLRAVQHRDLLTIKPDGSRVYLFHPWEKNIAHCNSYIATDGPILNYLRRLEEIGENSEDYQSIWFYF